MLFGVNGTDGSYGNPLVLENDLFNAGRIYSRPSNNEVPAANRDANKWPTSLAFGDDRVSYIFRSPETSANVVVLFTPGVASAVAAHNGCTIVSSNVATGTVTVTPTNVHPNGGGFALNFTVGSGVPKIISALPVGVTAPYSATWDNRIAALTSVGGPIRTMKRSGVEFNQGVIITSTAGAFPTPVLTAAKRNTLSSGEWYPNDGGGGGPVNDGPPMEADIAMAVHAGRPLWKNIGLNFSNDAIDALADLGAAAAIASGLTTYWEVANEDWLGSYPSSSQCLYEAIASAIPLFVGGVTPTVMTGSISGNTLTITAIASGPALTLGSSVVGDGIDGNTAITAFLTGSGGTGTYSVNIAATVSSRRLVANCGGRLERHIQKTCEVMDRIKARYVAAGAPLSKLKRCFMWGVDDGTSSSLFLNYAPPGFTALKNHVDVIGAAPYVSNTIQGTSVNALYDNVFSNIDWTIGIQWAAWQATATANGKELAAYEAGQGTFINDNTTRDAFHADSRMYDFNMHLWARMEAVAPGCAVCNFAYPHEPYSNQDFGIFHYSSQPFDATTHKANAARDYVLGKRKLIALTGTLHSTAGDAVNTVLGTLERRTPDSTITIPVNPSGAVTITDATAQHLQIKIANATPFASAGSVTVAFDETDPRDPAGVRRTTIVIPVDAAVSGTVWNAADKHTDLQISGGGVTLTQIASTSVDPSGRATTTKASGYFEVTVTKVGNLVIGLDAGSVPLSGSWVGATGDSVGYQANGNVLNNGGVPFSYPTFTTGDTIGICLKGGKTYFGKWNSGTSIMDWQGDPSAGTGGIPPASPMASACPMATMIAVGDAFTANFTGPFLGTLPTGVPAWG
jgi:hypothetical protein